MNFSTQFGGGSSGGAGAGNNWTPLVEVSETFDTVSSIYGDLVELCIWAAVFSIAMIVIKRIVFS